MSGRVMLIVNSLGRGGAEKQAALIAEGLLDRGRDVRILSVLDRADYASERLQELTTFLGKSTPWSALSLAAEVRRQLVSTDTVLAFNHYPNVLAWLSGAQCRRIVRYGNQPELDGVRGMRRALAGFAQRRSAASVGCTEGVSRAAAEYLGSPQNLCAWVANAATVAVSDQRPYERPYVISAGRLQPEKDFATAIRAFAQISKLVEHDLVIAGDGPLLGALERQVVTEGLTGRVKFVGYQSDLGDWLSCADLTVVTSKWEGFGSVIAESLSVGTPVVCADVPFGPAEILSRVPGGVLVPAGDANAVAAALVELLQDRTRREALSDVARTGAAREFSLESMQESYFDLIEQVEAL